MTEIDIREYFSFPFDADEPFGSYINDANGIMVADHGDLGTGTATLIVAVQAIHALYGVPQEPLSALLDLQAPFRFDPDEDEVLDAAGTLVLRIRGWGFLKYRGEEVARMVQLALGAQFVRALDALYAAAISKTPP
jgi:hypothetical protein